MTILLLMLIVLIRELIAAPIYEMFASVKMR